MDFGHETCTRMHPTAGLIGSSDAARKLCDVIRRVAQSDRPVLVTGPTGSGKELAVQAIHSLGPHPEEPFVDINCGALPEALIESLLFGHVRGAFTGANCQQHGFFRTVGRGTLFLDEIAELPLGLQAKLLRVLETHRYRPIGLSQPQRFEGRVVAATHADLEARVSAGTFREDLLYRLNVLEVAVPTLEERRSDIPALVEHFVSMQRRSLRFTPNAMRALSQAPWPGGIRQLRNLVDRLAVLAHDEVVCEETIERFMASKRRHEPPPLANLVRGVLRMACGDKLRLATQALTEEALRLSHGNKTAAARMLGVHRKVVERIVERGEARSFGGPDIQGTT